MLKLLEKLNNSIFISYDKENIKKFNSEYTQLKFGKNYNYIQNSEPIILYEPNNEKIYKELINEKEIIKLLSLFYNYVEDVLISDIKYINFNLEDKQEFKILELNLNIELNKPKINMSEIIEDIKIFYHPYFEYKSIWTPEIINLQNNKLDISAKDEILKIINENNTELSNKIKETNKNITDLKNEINNIKETDIKNIKENIKENKILLQGFVDLNKQKDISLTRLEKVDLQCIDWKWYLTFGKLSGGLVETINQFKILLENRILNGTPIKVKFAKNINMNESLKAFINKQPPYQVIDICCKIAKLVWFLDDDLVLWFFKWEKSSLPIGETLFLSNKNRCYSTKRSKADFSSLLRFSWTNTIEYLNSLSFVIRLINSKNKNEDGIYEFTFKNNIEIERLKNSNWNGEVHKLLSVEDNYLRSYGELASVAESYFKQFSEKNVALRLYFKNYLPKINFVNDENVRNVGSFREWDIGDTQLFDFENDYLKSKLAGQYFIKRIIEKWYWVTDSCVNRDYVVEFDYQANGFQEVNYYDERFKVYDENKIEEERYIMREYQEFKNITLGGSIITECYENKSKELIDWKNGSNELRYSFFMNSINLSKKLEEDSLLKDYFKKNELGLYINPCNLTIEKYYFPFAKREKISTLKIDNRKDCIETKWIDNKHCYNSLDCKNHGATFSLWVDIDKSSTTIPVPLNFLDHKFSIESQQWINEKPHELDNYVYNNSAPWIISIFTSKIKEFSILVKVFNHFINMEVRYPLINTPYRNLFQKIDNNTISFKYKITKNNFTDIFWKAIIDKKIEIINFQLSDTSSSDNVLSISNSDISFTNDKDEFEWEVKFNFKFTDNFKIHNINHLIAILNNTNNATKSNHNLYKLSRKTCDPQSKNHKTINNCFENTRYFLNDEYKVITNTEFNYYIPKSQKNGFSNFNDGFHKDNGNINYSRLVWWGLSINKNDKILNVDWRKFWVDEKECN